MSPSVVPDELVFDSLLPVEIPIKAGDKRYFLREADDETASAYHDARQGCLIVQNGTVVGSRGTAHTKRVLVAGCLFDAEGKKVGIDVVKKWPDRIVGQLFNEARRISFIQEDPPERVALEKALTAEGSPIDAQKLYHYVDSLPDSDRDYKLLKSWLLVDQEASVKN